VVGGGFKKDRDLFDTRIGVASVQEVFDPGQLLWCRYGDVVLVTVYNVKM